MSRNYRDVINLMRDNSADGTQTPNYQVQTSGFPCKIIPKSAYESKRGKQLEAIITHVVELRWYDDFKPNDVIENDLDNTQFNIKGIIDVDGDGRKMEIHCTEVVV